eukprot:7354495-Pyramimonas_sp.AAC.1
MREYGVSHATVAYAMHAFTVLPSGEIDVLGAQVSDTMIIDETDIYNQWISFLKPDASHGADVDEENGNRVINVDSWKGNQAHSTVLRACQGHSCFARDIER